MPIDLSHLDPDQRKAAEAPRGPVCILAGAGTGKTRTITYRMAHLIDQGFVSQNRVLAVTFTARAAEEMRIRLAGMGIERVQARTFHSAALRQLAYFWPQVAGDLKWELVTNKFNLVAQAARRSNYGSDTEAIRDLLVEIEWAKSSMISPKAYAEKATELQRDVPAPADQVALAYHTYEMLKKGDDVYRLDFDDVLLQTIAAFNHSRGVADEFRDQYRSFVVDEYQDVTPLQQRLLECWLGDRDDLTVVGDANQTIYSFTGATPDYLLDFTRKYEHATLVRLQRDYRSTPEITELANTVISKATGRFAGTRLELQGMRPNGPEPEFIGCEDEPSEAREVARRIRKLLDAGIHASQIAILFRINSQSAAFEAALSEAGIPYQVRGGEGFFQRNDIRRAISQLVVLGQQIGLSRRGRELMEPIQSALIPLGYSATMPEGASARERWHAFNALLGVIEEIIHAAEAGENGAEGISIMDILMELRARAEAKCPPNMESVTLASLHAAKGLEWDAVFLVGLTEGSMPISHALDAGPAAIEEERRLFYVGITRAREHLCCTWSLARTEGGRQNRKRSRFLDGLVADATPQPGTKKRRKAYICHVCGESLQTPTSRILGRCEDCPGELNPNLVEDLRAWRLTTSRERGVPAFQVLTDAKMLALAERMPTTPAEMVAIPGIGPHIIEQYGTRILGIIKTYL
ncbi:MAG: ATP-dependent DNA helicase UvrD2 [Corynebacterium sp.]|nr:ATP-dependent DNA helicase UvrD2 [Corynebacterium sp.]